eukprot:15186925-Ditylum_brightwellii.AAC.1
MAMRRAYRSNNTTSDTERVANHDYQNYNQNMKLISKLVNGLDQHGGSMDLVADVATGMTTLSRSSYEG